MKFSEIVGKKSQEFLNDYRKYADSWYFEIPELEAEFSSGGYCDFKELHLEEYHERNIMCVPIKEWLCTDTHVGMYEYYIFVSGLWQCVAITMQTGRKSQKCWKWLDESSFDLTKQLWDEYVLQTFDVYLLDLNSEVPDRFL